MSNILDILEKRNGNMKIARYETNFNKKIYFNETHILKDLKKK